MRCDGILYPRNLPMSLLVKEFYRATFARVRGKNIVGHFSGHGVDLHTSPSQGICWCSSDNIADLWKQFSLYSVNSLVNNRRISFMNCLQVTAINALMTAYCFDCLRYRCRHTV